MIDSNRFLIDFYPFFKKTTSCFIFLLLLFNTYYSQNKVWEQTNGPIGGSPEVFCDNKSGYIFCGNGEGLFRSSNNGNTWERILIANQNIGVDDMVNSINNKLYVVSDKNLYRSIDNGETWEKTPAFIHGIKISPDNILYGWRFSMMTKSIDDGLSWEIIYQGDFYSRSISKVFIDSRGFIYYTKESQAGSFTLSKDQGSSWKTIYLDKSDAIVLSFLEISNGTIIISTTKGFISSKDMSNSWVWNEGNGNNYFPTLLQYDGINNIYGLTNKGIAHSSDNGETWLENNVELNLMIRFFLSNNGYLFISDMKSGIYRSKPPNFNFTPAQDGFINTKIQSLAMTTKGELVASTLTSGIHLSGNGGESWLKFVNENDIAYPISLSVLNSDKIVFGTTDKVFYTSTDISALINITDNLPYFSSLLATYLNEIFAYTNYGFFKRDLSSDQWEFISNEIPSQDNNFRSLDIDQNGYFYLSSYAGLFSSTNGGINWKKIYEGAADIFHIDNKNNIYIGYDGIIHSSSSGEDPWTKICDLNTRIYDIETNSSNEIYVGTEIGIFHWPDLNSSWEIINEGIESISVEHIVIDEYDNIFIGTSGQGVYKLSSTTKINNIDPISNEFALFQNYPNPFNNETRIIYSVPEEGEVSLIIYDLLGKKIATLVNGFIQAGTYEIKFDGSNLSSGIYLYNLSAGKFSKSKKLVLLK